jgi:hypothetical protein
MTPRAPSRPLDLLLVGGLTVDRFADGGSAAGGSVLHAARALAGGDRGVTIGCVTAAGPEPEGRRGLAELRQRCASVNAAPHPATATFKHRASAGGRQLWLEQAGGPVSPPGHLVEGAAAAILFAPVADEVGADWLRSPQDARFRAAVLQGWLRSVAPDGRVSARSLRDLEPVLASELATLDLIVASREDLLADAELPDHQLGALRSAFGRRAVMIVTDGIDGVWLDIPSNGPDRDRRDHLPVPYLVDDSAAIGAGDMLAAFLAVLANDRGDWHAAVAAAMLAVAETLAARR